MRQNKVQNNIYVKQRKIGNYVKKYPHVHERFQEQIKIGNLSRCILGTLAVLVLIGGLAFLAAGNNDGSFLIVLSVVWLVMICVFSAGEKIGKEELLLMEKDFTGQTERFKGFGYRTQEALIAGFYRIPIAGLTQVEYNKVYLGGRTRYISIGMNFIYEDGTKRQAEITKRPEESDDVRFREFIESCGREVVIHKVK